MLHFLTGEGGMGFVLAALLDVILKCLAQFLPQIWHLKDKRRLIQKKYLDSASSSIQLERDQEQKDRC